MSPFSLPNNSFLSPTWGFKLTDTDDTIRQATTTISALLKRGLATGREIRQWKTHAYKTTSQFIEKNTEEKLLYVAQIEPLATRGIFQECDEFEENISSAVQTYMKDIQALLRQMNLLNPPLHSHHIEPYKTTLFLDLQDTLKELEKFGPTLIQLAHIKNFCLDLIEARPHK